MNHAELSLQELQQVQQSLQRCLRSEGFVSHFYDRFFSASADVAAKFTHTNMAHQSIVLKSSLHIMLLFNQPHHTLTNQPAVQRLARVHSRSQRDIPPHLYDVWLDCLIAAARQHDEAWSEALAPLWRRGMMKGIEFMKSHYDG